MQHQIFILLILLTNYKNKDYFFKKPILLNFLANLTSNRICYLSNSNLAYWK